MSPLQHCLSIPRSFPRSHEIPAVPLPQTGDEPISALDAPTIFAGAGRPARGRSSGVKETSGGAGVKPEETEASRTPERSEVDYPSSQFAGPWMRGLQINFSVIIINSCRGFSKLARSPLANLILDPRGNAEKARSGSEALVRGTRTSRGRSARAARRLSR